MAMTNVNVLFETKDEGEVRHALENLCGIFCASIPHYEFQNHFQDVQKSIMTASISMTYSVPNNYAPALQSCLNAVLTVYVARNIVSTYYVYR